MEVVTDYCPKNVRSGRQPPAEDFDPACYPGGLMNYNANDQLATDAYDANGNTTGSGTNAGANGYVYDFENHLIQQGTISFGYNGDGNRISKSVGGFSRSYLNAAVNPTGYVCCRRISTVAQAGITS
jgi:hypothetical protein